MHDTYYKIYQDRFDSLEDELSRALDDIQMLVGGLTSKYRKLGDIDTLADIELLKMSFNHLLHVSFTAQEMLKSFNKDVMAQLNNIKEVYNEPNS